MAPPMTEPGLLGLRDIVLPEPVSYVPATTAWGFVAIALLAFAGWLLWRRYVRWVADGYRRRALAELTRIEAGLTDPSTRPAALAALAPLVKRTALSVAPRERVAALTGEAWLRFLDDIGPTRAFVDGPGRSLEDLAFRAPQARVALAEDDVRALFSAVEEWIRGHRSPAMKARGG